MKSKVQIIIFDRVTGRQNEYKRTTDDVTALKFNWFRVTPTRDKKILHSGAAQCIEFYNGQRWEHITGLYRIDDHLYYGDIDKETTAIYIDLNNDFVKVAIIKGHRPKFRNTRKKRVIQFVNEQKKIRENSL
jgi:hypothetical protein